MSMKDLSRVGNYLIKSNLPKVVAFAPNKNTISEYTNRFITSHTILTCLSLEHDMVNLSSS